MKFFAFFFMIFLSYSVSSQTEMSYKSAFVVELAGSGGFGSINYERQFYKNSSLVLNWRIGFSTTPIDRNNGNALIFPIMVNGLIGKTNHKLELGVGQGLTITTKGSPFAMGLVAVGYRYQASDSRWFYKVAYTPLISYIVDFQVQQWAGVGIGFTF